MPEAEAFQRRPLREIAERLRESEDRSDRGDEQSEYFSVGDYDSDDDEEAIPFPWDFYDMKNKVVVDDDGWDEYEIEGVDNDAFGEYPGYDHPRREVPDDELTLVQRRAPMKTTTTSILLAM